MPVSLVRPLANDAARNLWSTRAPVGLESPTYVISECQRVSCDAEMPFGTA